MQFVVTGLKGCHPIKQFIAFGLIGWHSIRHVLVPGLRPDFVTWFSWKTKNYHFCEYVQLESNDFSANKMKRNNTLCQSMETKILRDAHENKYRKVYQTHWFDRLYCNRITTNIISNRKYCIITYLCEWFSCMELNRKQ